MIEHLKDEIQAAIDLIENGEVFVEGGKFFNGEGKMKLNDLWRIRELLKRLLNIAKLEKLKEK